MSVLLILGTFHKGCPHTFLKFCDGGYVFIINEKGETIYHPYLPSAFDFSNKEFYQNEMKRKKGWMDATYKF